MLDRGRTRLQKTEMQKVGQLNRDTILPLPDGPLPGGETTPPLL
jgi:hypothetical protein